MNSLDKKPTVNISILGGESSGKTTLRFAMAKYFWPKSKAPYSTKPIPRELRECGSTDPSIKFEYETEKRRYSHISFQSDPVSYLRGLVSGNAQIDGAILLVTASEGITLQTKLLVKAAQQLSVPRLVVFINKTDLLEDSENLRLIEMEIRALLNQYHFDGKQTPIINGSALNAKNGEAKDRKAIMTLMDAVDQYIPSPERAIEKPFLMPIEDVFSIPSHGTIATGRIECGVINTGDPVEIVGMTADNEKPLTATIKGVTIFRKTLARGEAGYGVGLVLQGIDKEAMHRGMVICAPGSVNQAKVFSAEVFISGINEGALKTAYFSGSNLNFRIRTASITGQITLPKEMDVVQAGDKVHMEVRLEKAIAMEIGLPFYITNEKGLSIGAGRITQLIE